MKKILAVLIALLVILLIMALGTAWVLGNYHIIDGKFYRQHTMSLDLREKDISISHYEKIREALPACEIDWEVPFQDGRYPCGSKTLAVTALTEADIALLSYFPRLESLDARESNDLSWLSILQEANPNLEVLYEISVGGMRYPKDTTHIETNYVTDGELEMLPYLTELELFTLTEGTDSQTAQKLGEYCQNRNIAIQYSVAGQIVTAEDTQLTIPGITEAQAQLLMLMPQLEVLNLPEPEAAPETIFALAQRADVTWEKTILGVTFPQNAVHINLNDIISRAEGEGMDAKTAYEYGSELGVMGTKEEVPSSVLVLNEHPLPDKQAETARMIAEVETALSYLPDVKTVEMCGAWLDNEAMAQFRENHREDYKVVWTVQCGMLATRTDAKLFMPTKYYVESGSFADWHAYNLKYCEEIIAMDIGHMSIADVSFLYNMPDIKYLDIALTHVQDLTPIASCKNLVFLVMHTLYREVDYSPLLECTALEDLNISDTKGDITPLLTMTQLKNLWLTGWDDQTIERAENALPNTNIGYSPDRGPNAGWRRIPNYYHMRDALLMFYM